MLAFVQNKNVRTFVSSIHASDLGSICTASFPPCMHSRFPLLPLATYHVKSHMRFRFRRLRAPSCRDFHISVSLSFALPPYAAFLWYWRYTTAVAQCKHETRAAALLTYNNFFMHVSIKYSISNLSNLLKSAVNGKFSLTALSSWPTR